MVELEFRTNNSIVFAYVIASPLSFASTETQIKAAMAIRARTRRIVGFSFADYFPENEFGTVTKSWRLVF